MLLVDTDILIWYMKGNENAHKIIVNGIIRCINKIVR